MGKRFYKPPTKVDYRVTAVINLFVFGGKMTLPEILIEALGYLGTALVIISMLMTSVVRLRIINMCGALISAVYAIIISAWPVALLNIILTVIQILQLYRIKKGKLEAEK